MGVKKAFRNLRHAPAWAFAGLKMPTKWQMLASFPLILGLARRASAQPAGERHAASYRQARAPVGDPQRRPDRATATRRQTGLAFTHVSVVDVARGALLPNQTVLVVGT